MSSSAVFLLVFSTALNARGAEISSGGRRPPCPPQELEVRCAKRNLICKIQYLAKANIYQKPIFGKSQYLAKANILQKPIFGKIQYLVKANICQKSIFGNIKYFNSIQINFNSILIQSGLSTIEFQQVSICLQN
jgi:hypothetical protein